VAGVSWVKSYRARFALSPIALGLIVLAASPKTSEDVRT
jgi:hypothetical protein